MQPVSFQLYSARDAGSLDDTLAMLAAIGYRQVEGFGGVYGDPPALRATLDHLGLTMPTGHFGLADLETDRGRCLEIARTLGIRTLVAPWLEAADRPGDAAGWRALGERLEWIAADYGREGLTLAWHNHDFEFRPLATGEIPQALLFSAAPSLKWEIDLGWVLRAGRSALGWINREGHRIVAAHVKDIARPGEATREDGWADVGHGTVHWQPIFAALARTPARIFIAEHDHPSDVERFARRSFATMQRL